MINSGFPLSCADAPLIFLNSSKISAIIKILLIISITRKKPVFFQTSAFAYVIFVLSSGYLVYYAAKLIVLVFDITHQLELSSCSDKVVLGISGLEVCVAV